MAYFILYGKNRPMETGSMYGIKSKKMYSTTHDRRRFISDAYKVLALGGITMLGFGMKPNDNPPAARHTRSGRADTRHGGPETSSILIINEKFSSLKHANGWLNSRALSNSDLKNKVIVVNFWTYTCINWLRQLPYIREWSQRYKNKGLIVIGVHTPEFGFEQHLSNVRTATSKLNVDYPVAIDNDRVIWETFNNNYWPALYVFDAKGKLRHQKFGEGGYDECEQVIKQLLYESAAVDLDDGLVHSVGKGVEAPADWNNLFSPENYLGRVRTENFISMVERSQDRRKNYTIPEQLKLNQWALSGEWTFNAENIHSKMPGVKIAYQFHARDLHLVMGPSMNGKPVQFRILINGESPGNAHGTDVDEKGNGIVIE
ncbi:MAG: redoxin domain-containing protein, partial [Chitinophagaceae bacterium]